MAHSTTRLAALAVGIFMLPTLVWSQGAPSPPPVTGNAGAGIGAPGSERPGQKAIAACRGDLVSLCAGVERGGGRKIGCLKENEAKLSAGCQSAIRAVVDGGMAKGAAKAAALKQTCAGDAAVLCAGIDKGGGRISKCLQDNAAKLSPACQSALQQRQQTHLLKKSARQACAGDQQALCGSAPKGHAAMLCLREKQAQASAACQQALASLPVRHSAAGDVPLGGQQAPPLR